MALRISNRGSSRKKQRRKSYSSLLLAGAMLLSALIISKSFKPLPPPLIPAPVVAEFDSVKIPVPVEFVPVGTRIKDIHFKTVAFPKHQVPTEALTSLDSVAEAVTLAPLPANLPLFQANLSLTAHTSNPVLERIPPGMRAMTIRVDATSSVEGWAGSGSIVDVLLVEKDRTSVIAEKVKILSAERSVSPVEGASAPNVPSTVTMLVSQEQCLAINTAIPLGRIAFALRSARDSEGWSETVYTKDNLKGGPTILVQSKDREVVTGYVSVKPNQEVQEKQAFVLANGKWVHTEIVPEGFLVASSR